MPKRINVEQTVANILAVKDVNFKILKKDEKTNTATLVTPTNDQFERGVISLTTETISIGVQSPDKEGKITLTLAPLTLELLELISYTEFDVPPTVEPVEEAPASK